MTSPPRYADGSRNPGKPHESRVNWKKLDVTRFADQLAGRLLLIYGDMDENVPPHEAQRLVDALTRANKPYDLFYLPNRTHSSGSIDGYMIKRTWDYFVKNLRGAAPVPDFKVEMRPSAAE